ncbi:uncharacterized protein LOC123203274 isoform X2 [Mangifera indica]|uniref:uncharacterized protein LOC123203274 isoform X2 n=1 Tax=Mangifera indica TaxID=29780 RepID=UPI001CFBE0DC|nr:uncharacterized protein LOC123203274 isoform X2 [Mangifera indica]
MSLSARASVTRLSACPSSCSSSLSLKYILSGRIAYTVSAITQIHQSCKIMASSTTSVLEVSSPLQDKITAPYGSWKSPITTDVVSGSSKRLGGTAVDGHGHLIWLESRPTESGRAVLVREPEKEGGEPIDITPKEFAVRTTAQEYGGGAFSIFGDTAIFSNYKDQRLYKQSIASKEPKILVSGSDFYAFPRMDSKGERIAWIEWHHPNMPWDKAELWVGYISDNGDVYKRVCVAGCDPTIVESPTEPKWSSKGELFFVTDRNNGYWNLYKWIESNNEVLSLYSLEAEFSRPLWVFGTNSYEIIESKGQKNLIACNYRQNGRSYLGVLDDAEGSISLLDIPFTDIDNITPGNHCLYIEGGSAVQPSSVAKVTLDGHKLKAIDFEILWSSSPNSLKYKPYFSLPELIEFPTEISGQKAYAYYYPPSNPNYQAIQGENPPLLLKSHGGPTSETRGILNLNIQYWTSRGWAFADVNYGGSTGYGREFRERLLGRWGIVDVNDCCSCATFLVDSGKADGERLCITGGSAGGYTTLAALAFRDTFKAGASLYGVADLSMLKAETHKFESRYMDNLVGSEKDFFERSPINFVDKFSCPIILFQGLEDKVVPPDQARAIYRALKEKGLPVALVEYEGEQHGFRKAENIKFTLEQQMVFFARLVGHFNVADDISPIKIDNFDS